MRQFCYAFIIFLLLVSCRDKVICPTFQSTYILDDSVRTTYFSYLWYLNEDERKNYLASNAKTPPPDSLGVMVASAEEGAVDYFAYTADYKVPPRETKRTKYGIAKRTPVIPNLVRNLQLKTAPMENVLTPPEIEKSDEPEAIPQDSSSLAPLDSTAAIAQVDSLNVNQPADSSAVAKQVEEKKAPWVPFRYAFMPSENMQPDQENYFNKYGWLLQTAPPKEESAADSTTTKKKKGFFKNLFKKKERDPNDTTASKGKEPKAPKEKKPREKKSKKEKGTEENTEGTKPEEDANEGFG
jgi:hypothetical protein